MNATNIKSRITGLISQMRYHSVALLLAATLAVAGEHKSNSDAETTTFVQTEYSITLEIDQNLKGMHQKIRIEIGSDLVTSDLTS